MSNPLFAPLLGLLQSSSDVFRPSADLRKPNVGCGDSLWPLQPWRGVGGCTKIQDGGGGEGAQKYNTMLRHKGMVKLGLCELVHTITTQSDFHKKWGKLSEVKLNFKPIIL